MGVVIERIDCKYKDICISYPSRCERCRNNENARDDYFEPREIPYLHYPECVGYDEAIPGVVCGVIEERRKGSP